MEKYNTLQNKKDFELFINSIPDYLENIKVSLKMSALNFNEEEIRLVSRHFIQLKNDAKFNNETKKQFIAYLGEAFIKKYDGIWFFTGLKKDSFAINEPVITKYKNEGLRKSLSETIFKIFENNDENYFNLANKYMEESQKKREELFAKLFPKKEKKRFKII